MLALTQAPSLSYGVVDCPCIVFKSPSILHLSLVLGESASQAEAARRHTQDQQRTHHRGPKVT